jgi:hypothetical protein
MKRLMKFRRAAVGLLLASASACASRPPPVPPTVTLTSGESVTPAPGGRGRAIVVQAASCWLDGLWADALGEKGPDRERGIEQRCADFLRTVGEPQTSYYPLRALDRATVARIGERLRPIAEADPVDARRAPELLALFDRVAAVARENVDARRAANQVKEVFEVVPGSADRRADKAAAAPELQRSMAFGVLYDTTGPFAADARTIALLAALERFEIARGLPKHLKTYALEGVGRWVFGVEPPALPADAATPIPSGTWLAYLTSLAYAGGYPLPPDATDPQNKEPLAWTGALAAIADRLRQTRGADPALVVVAQATTARLDNTATSEAVAFAAHKPAER